MDTATFGVFRLGQIWSVVTGEGMKRGFTSRDAAVVAAQEMAAARAADGQDAEIAIQDELGLLTTLRPTRG
jgi:hypothetical protein